LIETIGLQKKQEKNHHKVVDMMFFPSILSATATVVVVNS